MKNPLSSQARSEPFSAAAWPKALAHRGEPVHGGGEQAPHIQFPLNGSRIEIAGAGAMPVKVGCGVLPMTVLVNGVSVARSTDDASGWWTRRARALPD